MNLGVAVWVAVSLAVIWDVHHGEANLLNRSWTPDEDAMVGGRGLGLTSGEAAVGWIRADETQPSNNFHPGREELFDRLASCDGTSLVVEAGALEGPTDLTWWRYRNFTERIEMHREGFPDIVAYDDVLGADGPEAFGLDASGVLVVRRGGGGSPSPPEFGSWAPVRLFQWPDRSPIAVWAREGPDLCPDWPR